jgi:DNA-directed RNA polymerase specialized sigma24 family protein
MNEADATNLVAALFDHMYTKFFRYVLKTTANPHVAEDLVQDAFMLLYQTLRSGKDIEKPEAWTMCVLHRAANRQIQERSNYEELDETAFTQNWLEEDTDISAVRDLLSCLSPREIADELGISITSVNTLLARALQKLQKAVTIQQRIKEGRGQYEKKPVRRAS